MGNLLDSEKIYNAIKSPQAFYCYDSGWSFFDAEVNERDGVSFIAGRLSKFDPKAEVVISDPESQKESIQPEPNMRVASSHFVYIPSVSGVAFSKASPHIEENKFADRFSSVIKHTHENFFVDCKIQLIADLPKFAQELMTLETVYQISANLKLPNPIYGHLWGHLRNYMKNRRSDKMLIREEAIGREQLRTELPKIVYEVSKQTAEERFKPENELPIGDSAILMAADGYGSGHVKGTNNGKKIIIKTSETPRNFSFDEEPSNMELFEEAYSIFKDIENERHLKH